MKKRTRNLDEYHNFINECKDNTYKGLTHKHHIIPKFMGGSNDDENLIELSVKDHIQAHIILAESVERREYKNAAWWSVMKLRKEWNTDLNDEDLMEKFKQSVSGENNPFYGRTHTEETKRKIVESHPYPTKGKTYEEYYGDKRAEEMKIKISKSKDKYKKPILQFDLEGNFIKEWDSNKEIIREIGITHASDVCKGKRNKAGGFKWRYKYEY